MTRRVFSSFGEAAIFPRTYYVSGLRRRNCATRGNLPLVIHLLLLRPGGIREVERFSVSKVYRWAVPYGF